jgi:predicted nucleic acid-binding protein
MSKAFFDTNVLLYLLSEDEAKADRAEALMADGGVISVQVLNEFASVAIRKLRMTYPEVRDVLAPLRELCAVEPLTSQIHDLGLTVAERFGFSFYDALIAASALSAGCDTLYSEDFQDGQRIDEGLVIRNPFRVAAPQPPNT